jgi:DNA-binding transcriptional MocR family regulator
MPSRKADHIVQILRDEIVSGKRSPGEKLPTYDALMEQFQVTRVAFINGDRLERRVLSVLDFNAAVSPPEFSNPRDVVDQVDRAVAWPPPNTCSNTDELCVTAADCCDPRSICINNRCTARPIVK